MTRWLVIGGGSAGCVIAARLSENASNQVTLVEAGPDHGEHDATIGPIVDQPWRARPDVQVIRRPGARPEPYLQGFGLGGSSLLNGSVAVGDPAATRVGHELPIEPADPVGAVGKAVLAATPDAAPVGTIGRGQRRVTAADVYLRPARDRPNLTVRCGLTVDRLRFDRRCVVGADVAGERLTADRVAVCAGAIESPALLLRSGVDTPGTGEGLQDHLGVAISFEVLHDQAGAVPIGVTVERPGRQIVVIDRLPTVPTMGALLAGYLDVTSEGRVTVGDDGVTCVELNQLARRGDVDGLSRVVREALELASTPSLRELIGPLHVDDRGTPASVIDEDVALRSWLPGHLGGYHHVAASCRTGVVLAEDGALLGYEGVVVCDASALRGVPRRNPYLTVVRHAETMARRWLTM